MPLLPIALDVAGEGAGQGEDRQRRREHQEAEAEVPFAQLFGVQPAAKEDFPHEPHHPLDDRQHQQDQHAVDEGFRLQSAGRFRRRRAVEGDGMDIFFSIVAGDHKQG